MLDALPSGCSPSNNFIVCLGWGYSIDRAAQDGEGSVPLSLLVLCVLCLPDPIVCPSSVSHVCCPQLIPQENPSLLSTGHFGSSLQGTCREGRGEGTLTTPSLPVHLPALPNDSKKALFLRRHPAENEKPPASPSTLGLGWPWGVRTEFLIPPFPQRKSWALD